MWLRKALAVIVLASSAPLASAQSFERNVDRPGGDLRSFFFQGGPHECRAACGHSPGCVAWTYVRAGVQGDQARCWLKASIPPANGNICCISGIMRGYRTGPTRVYPQAGSGCCPQSMLVCPLGRHFCR